MVPKPRERKIALNSIFSFLSENIARKANIVHNGSNNPHIDDIWMMYGFNSHNPIMTILALLSLVSLNKR